MSTAEASVDRLVTTATAARMAGMSRYAFERCVVAGKVRPVIQPARTPRYTIAEVERFVRGLTSEAAG